MESKLKKLHIPDGNLDLLLELKEFFEQKGYTIVSRFIKGDKEYHFVIKR